MVSFRCPARLIEAVRAVSERTGWSDSATLVTLLDAGIDSVQGDGKKGAERHRWVEAAEKLHKEEERAATAIMAAKAEYRRLTKGAGKEPPLVPSVRRRKVREVDAAR